MRDSQSSDDEQIRKPLKLGFLFCPYQIRSQKNFFIFSVYFLKLMNLQLFHLLQSFYYNDNIIIQYIFDSTWKRDNSFDYSSKFSFL